MIAGIDYGSKLAGTTVIAYTKEERIEFICSKRNQDADKMISDFVNTYRPKVVGIDAPLSLPGVYAQMKGYDDYFYRASDRALNAMSPMFLGGLTARAMRLKSMINPECKLIEVYPAMAAKSLALDRFAYKKKMADYESMLSILKAELPYRGFPSVKNSHQLDAMLALKIVSAYIDKKVYWAGNLQEGLIYY